MNQKWIKQLTQGVLFLYIIIFSTATTPVLNRAGLVAVACCGGLYCMLNGATIKTTVFFRSMLLYGGVVTIARIYTTALASKVDMVFNGYISMLIVIFVVTIVTEDEKDVKLLLKAFAVSAFVQCIYMLSVYGTNIVNVLAQSEEGIRIGSEVSNANSVGISFAIGYIISLHFLLNEKMSFYAKIFYAAVAIIGFVFGLLSGSRKVILLLLAGSFAILYLKSSGKNLMMSFIGILVAAIVVYVLYDLISTHTLFSTANNRFTALLEGLQEGSKLDHSSRARFRMIEVGWDAFKESPFMGKGLYASYHYFKTYSHNNFIEILMNTGLIGFFIFYYPYFKGIKTFLGIDKSNTLYPIMLILFLWVLISGYGMVTYYSKDAMTLMALVDIWLSIQRSKKHEKIT